MTLTSANCGAKHLAHGRDSSGLGIARNILREHGGDVRLDNYPDGGLVATVELPAGVQGH